MVVRQAGQMKRNLGQAGKRFGRKTNRNAILDHRLQFAISQDAFQVDNRQVARTQNGQ
jgi:hypothetical protein